MSAQLEHHAAAQTSFTHLLGQLFTAVPPLHTDINLDGKTALVTGANIGIGFEYCRLLLKLGVSRLIMGVRSLEKGQAAATRLRSEVPKANRNSSILVWQVDMESLRSVEDFASRCERDLLEAERLHVVVLNAGMAKQRFERVDEKPHRETTLQVNYISTALLAILLLPKLRPSSSSSSTAKEDPGRLTLITSDSALGITLNDPGETALLESLQLPDEYNGLRQYSVSKLLLNMFVAHLAEVVDPAQVTVNTCNPGPTKGTGFFDSVEPSIMKVAIRIMSSIFGRSGADSARTYAHASLVLGEESHGSYSEWKVRPWPVFMYTDVGRRLGDRLWDETIKEFSSEKVDRALERVRK